MRLSETQLRKLIRKELNEIKALKRLFSKPAGNKITVKNPTPGGSDLELPEEVYAAISEVNPALASAIDAVNAGTPRSTDRYKVRGQWPRLVKFSTMEPVEIKSLFGSLDVDYMIAQIKDKSEIMDWNIHKQEGPLGRQHNIMLVKRPTQEQMKFGVVDPFWAFDNAGISDPKARGSVWVPKRFSQKFEHTRGQWTGPLYAYVWSSGDRQYGKGGYTWHILDNNNTNLMILTSRGEWASPAAAVKSMKREFFDKFETHLR